MPNATDAIKQAIRAKFPGCDLEVFGFQEYDAEFIVRPPTGAVWRIFVGRIASPQETEAAKDDLFDACVLWPEKAERHEFFEKRPATKILVINQLGEMVGTQAKITRSKL